MLGSTIGSLSDNDTPFFERQEDGKYANDSPYYEQPQQQQTMYNPNFFPPPQLQPQMTNIEELARDINYNLGKETMDGTTGGANAEQEEKSIDSAHFVDNIYSILKDPLIIFVLFMILSNGTVKETIGKYITQINPNQEGVVPFAGVVIYGLLFAVLFALIKRFV